MSRGAQIPPTFDELYERIRNLPEGQTGEILVPGVLRTMGRPCSPHRRAARRCLAALRGIDANEGGSGWWIEIEAEVRFPLGRLAAPDLAGWRVERVPEPPEDNPIDILPDWCCEILSPSTAQDDRALKLPLYAAAGAWVWLVDPALRIVEAFEPAGGRPALAATGKNDEVLRLPPFDTEVALGAWWSRLAPSRG